MFRHEVLPKSRAHRRAGRRARGRLLHLHRRGRPRGRPERSVVLTGLRGVGKTVLLNQLRSAAISR
ncbi:hypothetical protein, partial [Rhodococcus aetherivorans]|uniref:hypothetical protein n=1 Tax=Rhodococcus aetherivorans TaxID=191292 RepID=UPI0019D2FD6A